MARALPLSMVGLPWIGLVLAATTLHAEPATPLPPAEQQSLDGFAKAHKDCNVWSDGCVVCRRLQETAFACSTPGIACQPTSLACEPQKPDQTPAEASKPAPAPKDAH